MVNKESQRRKIKSSKKESKRQTRKTERESRGYAKKNKGERQKVEDRESRRQRNQKTRKERLKRIGSEKTKMKKCMLHLENEQKQRKEGRKRRIWCLHDISVLGRYPQGTRVKDLKDHKENYFYRETGRYFIILASFEIFLKS